MRAFAILAVPLAALAALSVSISVFQSEQWRADREVRQIAQTRADCDALVTELLQAEATLFDYLLQGQDVRLEPYKVARDKVPQIVDRLEGALRSNRWQHARLAKIRSLVDQYLDSLAGLRQFAAIPGVSPANPPTERVAANRELLGLIRHLLGEIRTEEGRRMDRVSSRASDNRHQSEAVVVVTVMLGVLGGIAAAWFSMRTVVLAERRRAEATVQQSHQRLETLLDTEKAQAKALAGSESALRQQTELLESVLRCMSDAVLVIGPGGDVILSNDAAKRILDGLPDLPPGAWAAHFGLCRTETGGAYAAEELPWVSALEGDEISHTRMFAARLRAPEGTWLSVTVRSLRDKNGHIEGVVLVIADVSADERQQQKMRQAKEEAERANAAKSEFLSRMSHELRTPLNAILGFAQLLEMAKLQPADEASVDQILRAGRHLLNLINEVLDIARIESGRLTLSLEPVRVSEVVGEVLDMMRPHATSRNVSLDAGSALQADLHVIADRQRLKQVILNLLSNAIKYNLPDGNVNLSLELSDDSTRLNVTDTGPGIPAARLGLLFSPFERLGAEHTGIEGTGIGLALAKGLVEAMGGRIGVNSEEGSGSTFWIEFQNAECLTPDPALKPAGAPKPGAAVLCIEDNPSNLLLIEHALAHQPLVQLLTAVNACSGLEVAREQKPGLILLDVHLPDMDGADVLKNLRDDPRTASIPVVVVSADATARQEERMRAAGAVDYLTKPLDIARLLKVIEETLDHADAR